CLSGPRNFIGCVMENNDMVSTFAALDFDPNLYASSAVGANKAAEVLRSVNDVIRRLDASVFQHVASHHSDLLKKATDVDSLHNVLESTESKITSLSRSMDQLKRKVIVPYRALQSQITQFRHLQISCELLRKISRMALLVKRIQSRLVDLSKSSAYVNELEYLFSTMDWEGIHILESYKRFTEQSREDMISQAYNLINASYELADQVQLGLGLQIFQHVNMLPDVVCQLVKQWQTDFDSVLNSALDVEALIQKVRTRHPNSATTGPGKLFYHSFTRYRYYTGSGRASLTGIGGQAAAFHVALWTSLDGTVNKLEHISSQFRLLGLTLLNKREVSSSVSFAPIFRLDSSVEPCPSLAELLLHEVVNDWYSNQKTTLRASVILLFASANLKSLGLTQEQTYLNNHLPEGHADLIDSETLRAHVSELDAQLRSSEGFIGWAVDHLAQKLMDTAERSPQVKEALEGEYPKLLKLVLDLDRRIRFVQPHYSGTDSSLEDKRNRTDAEPPSCLIRSISPFETAYLSRSLSRLFDQVSMAFSTSTSSVGLDSSEVDGIVQNAASELAYATVQYDLLCKVSRNVSKTVALFATNVENMISVGPEANDVMDAQTVGQQNNIRLVNLLCAFGTQLSLTCSRRLRNLPVLHSVDPGHSGSPFQAIHDTLESRLNVLCMNIFQPLLHSIGETFENILSTMHGENFADSDDQMTTRRDSPRTSSAYMVRLQDFIGRVRKQHLCGLSQLPSSVPAGSSTLSTTWASKPPISSATLSTAMGSFPCGEVALQYSLRPFLTRWIDAFLYNVSLVSPLNERGRLRLAADCAEFELALAPLLASKIGSSLAMLAPEAYARLRAFRPILLAETERIADAFISRSEQISGARLDIENLPPSLVCQHLFSRAPAEIRPPHSATGWSTTRYIAWALAQTEDAERMEFLRNGLTIYTREVHVRQQREYPPIYVQLRAFLQHFEDKTRSMKSTEEHNFATQSPIIPCA
ncbi:conserved oligomeric Golgi complex subunit 5, partial [Paragonimus westermani]